MNGGRAAAQVVDALVSERVLVVGSAPATGSDVDIMARPGAESSLRDGLPSRGWIGRGDVFLVVRGGCCLVVDLEPSRRCGLADAVVEELFAAALPMEGYRWLVTPAPHHDLLLLARRFGSRIGSLSALHLERVRAALAADPNAWARAGSDAQAWGLVAELIELQRFVQSGPRASTPARHFLSRLRRRPSRRGGVVAVSGVDGAGKSTQTAVVAAGLRALGYDADVEWTRITYDPSLERIARPVKALLSLRSRGTSDATLAGAGAESDAPARSLRERSRLIGAAWVLIVAIVDALVLRRSARAAMRTGGVVVRDRYALDSVVQLLDQYGSRFRLQAQLIARFAPRPRAAFLLDVAPETAFGRKPEEYDVAALTRHRDRYLSLVAELGVVVVNGDRDPDVISLELLLGAWAALQS